MTAFEEKTIKIASILGDGKVFMPGGKKGPDTRVTKQFRSEKPPKDAIYVTVFVYPEMSIEIETEHGGSVMDATTMKEVADALTKIEAEFPEG